MKHVSHFLFKGAALNWWFKVEKFHPLFLWCLYEAHEHISPADPWTFVQRLQATVEAFFDTQYEQHLRPASQTRHGEFPFIGGKSRLVTVGEVLYPSAPVIPCEVWCLGTQTKPTPKPLAEGRAQGINNILIQNEFKSWEGSCCNSYRSLKHNENNEKWWNKESFDHSVDVEEKQVLCCWGQSSSHMVMQK